MIERVFLGIVLSVLVACGGSGGGSDGAQRETVVTERVIGPSSERNIIIYGNGRNNQCEIVTLPLHGAVIEPQSCTFHFSPEKGYVGLDEFVVRVTEYSYGNPSEVYRIVEQQLTMYIYFFNTDLTDVLDNDAVRYSKFIRTNADTWEGNYSTENLAKGIGDFNGDGIDDFAISRRHAELHTLPLDVAIVYGQAHLPKTITLSSGDDPFVNPYGYAFRWSGEEAPNNREFRGLGWVEPAGDYNNDGYDDLLMTGDGRVVVFGGNESSNLQQEILTGNTALGLAQPEFIAEDGNHYELAGSSSLGDVDGDLIPEFSYSDGNQFYLFPGGDAPQDFPMSDQPSRFYKSVVVGSDSATGWHEHYQNGAGDINGDGLADFILYGVSANTGQSRITKTVLFYGNAALQRDRSVDIAPDVIEGATTFNWEEDLGCGKFRGILDDVDGDGYDDIAIGCENYAYLGVDFVDLIYGGELPPTMPLNVGRRTRIEGDNIKTAISLGDINGDGFGDFAVYKSYSSYFEDYFYIIYGSESLPAKITLPTRFNEVVSNVSYFRYKDFRNIAPAGDIDSDGFDDFLISTTEDGNSVYLIYGGQMFKQPRLPQYE